MSIALPHTFHDNTGELASGQQVDENFAALVAAVEGIGSAAAGADVYQAGVVAATDWVIEGHYAINTATAALTFTGVTGAAWLPAPAGALVRTFTAPLTQTTTPPVLPGPGGYLCVGVELTASGATAALSLVSGAEKGSQAEAIAAPPAVSAGKVRILDSVIRNNAGVYSVPQQRDRRPWARGAYVDDSTIEVFGPFSEGSHVLGAFGIGARRVEIGAAGLLEVSAWTRGFGFTSAGTLAFMEVKIDGVTKLEWPLFGGEKGVVGDRSGSRVFQVGAGSHLIEWVFHVVNAGEVTLSSFRARLRELLAASANNGTS